MGKKIFVSYKFADKKVYSLNDERNTTVRSYVDKLQEYIENTDNIYKGESDDEDLSDLSEETIWNKLKDRIYDSSITIVMISPNMKLNSKDDKSQWIPWEISFSLKETTRNDRTSHSNAILAVALPDENNNYDYIIEQQSCCKTNIIKTDTLFNILKQNMFNHKNPNIVNNFCHKTYSGNHSYIKIVKWHEFILEANKYIDIVVGIQDNINNYYINKEI